MQRTLLSALLIALLALPALAADDPLAELRHRFTVAGKPVPPEVFADFGDSDLADPAHSIRVTIDLRQAVGSELYADPIVGLPGQWLTQKKSNGPGRDGETTTYKYIGPTRNGLLVAVAAYNGGGSGWFTTLHILDAASAKAFDDEGKTYDRLNLTVVRNVVLGDRWRGAVTIAGDTITIETEPGMPNNGDPTPTKRIIEARRP